MPTAHQVLHILFYPSEEVADRWVAHCLNNDLIGTGETPSAAFFELVEVIELDVATAEELRAEGKRVARPAAAPQNYWDAFANGIELPPCDITDIQNWLEKRKAKRPKWKECRSALLPTRDPLAVTA